MPTRQSKPARRIAFISSNDAWGGSEELWSRAAIRLARTAADVSAFKYHFNRAAAPAQALRDAGCRVIELGVLHKAPAKIRAVAGSIWPLQRASLERLFRREFTRRRPDLVVISQGLNHDGWNFAATCRRLGVPYMLISQKASDLYWPADGMLDAFIAMYREASAALFVSRHNLTLTEEQLGFDLPNGRVVRNPFNADWHHSSPWPAPGTRPTLVCLARLDAREKGQDLLLRVLAMPKWRERDLIVRLHGSGQNEGALKNLASRLALGNVVFAGFSDSPEQVWADAHGLILPSRCEGLPLSLIEAMLHGRIAIVTDAGGNREALVDGKTGFLADAATEASLDAALERAWQRREDWPSMGAAAAALARTLVEPDPVQTLADLIVTLAESRDVQPSSPA